MVNKCLYIFKDVTCKTWRFLSFQVRDEYRQDYDPARGGYGKLAQLQRGPDGQKF